MADNLVVTGIEFDSNPLLQGVQKSDKALRDLETRVEKTAATTRDAQRKYVVSAEEQQRHQKRIIELEKQYQAEQAKRAQRKVFLAEQRANSEFINQFQKVDKSARNGARGVGELRESLASFAARAAGANPIVGRLLNVFGSMAMGSVAMAGALGGLAAVGLAWRKLTEETRENRKETEEALEELSKLADMRATQGQMDKINLQQRAFENMNDAFRDMQEAQANFDRLTAEGKSDAAQIASDRVGRMAENFQQAQRLYNEARLGLNEVRDKDREDKRKEAERLAREAGVVPEFDKLMRALKEQELGFAQSERAAFAYALSLNKELTPAQRQLVLAQFDATQAAEADRREREEAVRAAEQNAKAVEDTIRKLEEQNIELRLGEDALLRHTLAQKGATEAQIRHAVATQQANREMEKARKDAEEAERDAEREAERREREREREIERHADQFAGAAGDAFGAWVSGAQEADEAFRTMIESMIAQLARLTMQKAFVDPLSSIFAGIIGGAIGGAAGGGASGAHEGSHFGSSLQMAPVTQTSSSGSSVVVHVNVPITAQSLDPRTMSDLLREQKGQLGAIVGDAVRESSALRSMFKGN